jgi:Sulfotransferase family
VSAPGAPAPFVVGVGRSGTTLLRLMLDAHPELAIGPETQFVPDLIEQAEAGASAGALVDAIVAARTWADFGLAPEELADRASGEDLAGVLRAFYALYAESRKKPRWGEKTPGYVRRMQPIGDLLGEARFVHLIRDGRDVALSRRARGMGAGKPMAATAELWRKRIDGARRQAKSLDGRYIELRYEDLVADPEPSLRRVCELIELGFDPAMLRHDEGAGERLAELGDLDAEGSRQARDAGERAGAHVRAKEAASTARTGVWRTEMDAGDRHEFEVVAGPLLRELGYDVPS